MSRSTRTKTDSSKRWLIVSTLGKKAGFEQNFQQRLVSLECEALAQSE
jgi:hypothetical protein